MRLASNMQPPHIQDFSVSWVHVGSHGEADYMQGTVVRFMQKGCDLMHANATSHWADKEACIDDSQAAAHTLPLESATAVSTKEIL